MINIQNLKQFLLASNQAGYAAGDEKQWIKEDDLSTTIPFQKDFWKLHDNFFGGEPYGGRIVVHYEDKPVWMMVYYGWVVDGVDPEDVYKILRGALKLMPADHPYRGPEEYKEDGYTYTNSWTGEIDQYSGEEQITLKSKLIYKANYMGGLVDQRSAV